MMMKKWVKMQMRPQKDGRVVTFTMNYREKRIFHRLIKKVFCPFENGRRSAAGGADAWQESASKVMNRNFRCV